MIDFIKAFLKVTYRMLTGRCENCGSKNIHEWSTYKAYCEDCKSRYY